MFTSSISLEGLAALTQGKDPVCGTAVEASRSAGVSTYKGNTYYFCCSDCKAAFVAQPDKYVTTGK